MNYYSRYTRTILNSGTKITPRGLPVIAKYNVTFATVPGFTYRREKDNPLIGFMEGLQFIAGIGDIDAIARVAPHADLSLFTGQSIYGPRAGDQTQWVIDELNKDPDSRRATIIISDQHEPLETRACTTCMQFQKIGHELLTIVSMRSSDAVYGLPYDLVQFGMMSQMIGVCTRSVPTRLIINIGNAHIYEKTAHLATSKHTPWLFTLPRVSDKFDDWVYWAKKEMDVLTMSLVKEEFDFKEEKEDGRGWL